MSDLDSIISVSISRETTVPTRTGFGYGNFLSNQAVFSSRITYYGSQAELEADTLAGADTILFGSKYFGQEIRPSRLYVTKKGRALPSIIKFTVSASFVTSNSIALSVDGVALSATAFTSTHAATMTALAAKIATAVTVASATVTGTNEITVTSLSGAGNVLSGFLVTGGASQPTATIVYTQYADSVLTAVASLQAAEDINNDWYGLAAYDHTDATIALLAAYTQARTKIYLTSQSDSDIIASGSADSASTLLAAGYDRTAIMYSADAANYPEGAWMGGNLPKDPGSFTWAYKSLSGITVDTLTTAQQGYATAKNANIYIAKAGVSHTEFGTMASGEYIDVIHGVDFIQVRMQEEIFARLVNEEKIPYTNPGVAVIENIIRQVLTLATNQGILAADPAYTVTVPDVADVSTVDKGHRLLPDVSFEGTLAGAIHKVTISGVLTL